MTLERMGGRAPEVAVLTIAHRRHDALIAQVGGLSLGSRPPDLHVVVAMRDEDLARNRVPITTDRWPTLIRSAPAAAKGLPLAAARNQAAQVAIDAGSTVLIFLDVDCIAGPRLVEIYAEAVLAARRPSPALWCGDIGYLPPQPVTGYPLNGLASLATFPDGCPVLPMRTVQDEPRFEVFRSASFAMSAADFTASGGFCPRYVGYGGEDIDFAQVVKAAGGSMTWLGGATAYHQHHESQSPPDVEAVVRNANVFHERWGWWPMEGWLETFATRGLAKREGAESMWVVAR